jgi:hypothetical protein
MIPISLGTSSYESASKKFSAQRCINLYHVVAEAQSLNDSALFFTPGIVALSDLGDYPSRGSHTMDGVEYNVNETSLYSIDENGDETEIGTIAGSARCSFADNGDKLCIVVPGGNAYVYVASTDTLSQITDPDYQTADTVSYNRGFYIFTQSDGEYWFISALNDPTDIDALDYDAAEVDPDLIVAGFSSYDEVYIFGQWTIQAFRYIGGADFPYENITGGTLEKGLHAKYSPIMRDSRIYFIGGGINEQSSIYRTSGFDNPEKISTDAIDTQIQKFTTTEISNAFSFAYSIRGYQFVGFTFQSTTIDSKTFVYNLTASKLLGRHIWLEQQTGTTDNYWDVASIDFVYNKLLITRLSDGQIGYLDVDTATEFSDEISRIKTLPPISSQNEPFSISKMQLTVDSGQGTISGQGSDPKVILDWSDDGARTWSNEVWRSIGKIGKYKKGTVWNRLGRASFNRVFRIKMTDPVITSFIKMEADVN